MNKAISDYEALSHNDFYALYMNKLSEHSKNLALRLKTVGLDGVQKLQGELASIDWALNCPKILIDELMKGEQK